MQSGTEGANPEQGPKNESAKLRTRRLKLAVLTSLAGKGISVLVQFAALPLAIVAMGPAKFGAYAMAAAILNWTAIASVSVTPGLTIALVSANAKDDRRAAGEVFTTAFYFSNLVAVVLLAGVQVVIHQVGVRDIFGPHLSEFEAELSGALVTLSVLMAANIVLSVAEAAQAGYQNQYVHNLFLSGGNVLTILAIALLVRAQPTIANMILAVYAAPLIARACSLCQLLWSHRHLIPRIGLIRASALRALLTTGSAFMLTAFASFCYQSFSVYWVGRSLGAPAAAVMSICTMIMNVSGSILLMFTQPLWPAIQDAKARHDVPWIRRAYLRFAAHSFVYVGIAALVIAFAADNLAQRWVGHGTGMGNLAQALLGLYFLLVAWEHVNYSFLVGLGNYWFASLPFVAGAAIMLLLSVWLVEMFGVGGMLGAMCAGPLLVTSWLYPTKIRRVLADKSFALKPPN